MDEAKPQCGGGSAGEEEEYDLPLHVAGLCMIMLLLTPALANR